MAQDRLEQLKNDALAHFEKATSAKELYDFKVHYLGKNGQITEVMKDMGKLSKEERPAFGKKVNEEQVMSSLSEMFVTATSILGCWKGRWLGSWNTTA